MELSLSGNALRTFSRSITCLARVGNELVIQASPSQLALHTLNSSRSAYQSITFKPNFFDVYGISGTQVQCSVLLKAVCSVLRTPMSSIDHLTLKLADPDASKVQWALECYSGMKKAYWITCNVEPDIQHLSLDRRRFPSNLVVRPRDLNRLLANFQSSLQEITIIATEPMSLPSDAASEIGGKAVELRSYIDPTKDNDSSLHTQLWIDPMEECVQYTHTGDPVDVTFSVKELKAARLTFTCFLTKRENDGSGSNFDAALVLATMLISQLHEGNPSEPVQAAVTVHDQAMHGTGSQAQQERSRANVSEHPSDHTRIWSDLSGSAAKSGSGVEERQVQKQQNLNASEQRDIQRISMMNITKDAPIRESVPAAPNLHHQVERDHVAGVQDTNQINGHALSQRHPSNWVDADEDDDDDDDGDENENELCVQSTPPYYEEQ
ncbi:Cell cycle checkpoint control protein family isoform 5 [Theobroma cacao]|uniref:Cell cycle checkpoint control protein family isoform 5 n=1 Tax=Theobroma cacao TaxID=3641 RepID=A0A061F373_THECC|nr:Cell cycle checkpoint control protein family isoform 5 [Theobroma cacao]